MLANLEDVITILEDCSFHGALKPYISLKWMPVDEDDLGATYTEPHNCYASIEIRIPVGAGHAHKQATDEASQSC